MPRDNPRKHRITLTYARPPIVGIEAWSYSVGRLGREFHVGMIDKDGKTVGQGRFVVRSVRRTRDAR